MERPGTPSVKRRPSAAKVTAGHHNLKKEVDHARIKEGGLSRD